LRAVLLLLCAAACVCAQDAVSVTSPDGRLEFHLGVVQPPAPGSFVRIAYGVRDGGKPVIETSYLGYWIHDQEPILGENVGLSDSKRGQGEGYNWVLGEFLQNGSLGRRINVEARVFNDRVMFRYIIPRSTALDDAVIDSEETEFRIAGASALPPHTDLPFVLQAAGGKWVGIGEVAQSAYPRLSLSREDANMLLSDVALPKSGLPLGRSASLTSSWRIVAVGENQRTVSAALPIPLN
jgi:hypothetical protein